MRRAGLALLLMLPTAAQAEEPYSPLVDLTVTQLSDFDLFQRGLMPVELGEIALPSGQIVTTDPLVAAQIVSLELTPDVGTYPVRLITLLGNVSRPAFAILQTNACAPVLWQPAVPVGQSLADLPDGYLFGYGVDAGTGSFADRTFWEGFGAYPDGGIPGPDFAEYGDTVLFELMFPDTSGIPRNYITERNGASIAVFSAGWGDGYYGSYWGFSETGCPCALVTDFGLLFEGVVYDADPRPAPVSAAQYSHDPAQTGSFAACTAGTS